MGREPPNKKIRSGSTGYKTFDRLSSRGWELLLSNSRHRSNTTERKKVLPTVICDKNPESVAQRDTSSNMKVTYNRQRSVPAYLYWLSEDHYIVIALAHDTITYTPH
jgi:hypothetical protein